MHKPQPFIEEDSVPNDSEIIEYTHKYVNKNGARDKRFKDNPQIPVVKYYDIEFRTEKGLHERFEFSNWKTALFFATQFEGHRTKIANLAW